MLVFKKHGGVWLQYAYVFDYGTATATEYKNGAPHSPIVADRITNWFAYSGGDFTLEGADIAGAAAAAPYDELVIVPYAMTAAMVAAFYAEVFTRQIPFSELPLLSVAGDIIPDGPKFFVGSTASGEYEPALVSAAEVIGKNLKFTLTEFQGLPQ